MAVQISIPVYFVIHGKGLIKWHIFIYIYIYIYIYKHKISFCSEHDRCELTMLGHNINYLSYAPEFLWCGSPHSCLSKILYFNSIP